LNILESSILLFWGSECTKQAVYLFADVTYKHRKQLTNFMYSNFCYCML